MNTFCNNVRQILSERGLTHDAAAALLGMPRTNFSRLLRGLHEPRLGLIERLADVLEVSPADLLAAPERSRKLKKIAS